RYFILPPSSFILGFALPPLASNDLLCRASRKKLPASFSAVNDQVEACDSLRGVRALERVEVHVVYFVVHQLNWRGRWRTTRRPEVEMQCVTVEFVKDRRTVINRVIGVAVHAGAGIAVSRNGDHVVIAIDTTHLAFEIDRLSVGQLEF